jgi:hypothetical protein
MTPFTLPFSVVPAGQEAKEVAFMVVIIGCGLSQTS